MERGLVLSPVHMGKLTNGQDEEDKSGLGSVPNRPEGGSSGSYDRVSTPVNEVKPGGAPPPNWADADETYRRSQEAQVAPLDLKVASAFQIINQDGAQESERDTVPEMTVPKVKVKYSESIINGDTVNQVNYASHDLIAVKGPVAAAREARKGGHKRRDKEPAPITEDQRLILERHGTKEEKVGRADMSKTTTSIVAATIWQSCEREDTYMAGAGAMYHVINAWPAIPAKTVSFIQRVALRHYTVGPVVAVKEVADTDAGLVERMRNGGYIDCGDFLRAAAVVQDAGTMSAMVLYRFEQNYTPLEAAVRALEREAYLKYLVSSSNKAPFSEMRGTKDASYQLFPRGIRSGTANLFVIAGNGNYLFRGAMLQSLASKFDLSGRLAKAVEESVAAAWVKVPGASLGGRGGRGGGRGGNRGGRGGFGQSRDRAGHNSAVASVVQPADDAAQ